LGNGRVCCVVKHTAHQPPQTQAMVGGMVGRRSARRQMEGMQKQSQQAQAQQAQQAQAQQAQQAQASAKTDPMQEIAKLGDLKAKGLLTEEEFQKMKANLIAKM
jgi:membrane protease subunit (stomatin/prohibitin family)